MRKLTHKEREDIRRYQGVTTMEVPDDFFEFSVAFDNYITDGPGYAGLIIVVVWPSGETETFCRVENGGLRRWN